MTAIVMERTRQTSVSASGDSYLAGYPISTGGRVKSFSARMNIHSGATPLLAPSNYVGYGWSVWQVALQDDHLANNFDTIWDELVPKSANVVGFDFATGTADASGADEPGEITDLLDVALGKPARLAERFRYVHMSDSPWTMKIKSDDTFVWLPWVTDEVAVAPNIITDGPGSIILGFTSPDYDSMLDNDLVLPVFGGTASSEWLWYRFLDESLDLMIVAALGLIEAGAESPYEDVMDLIEFLLVSGHTRTIEPSTATWTVFAESKCLAEVPGRAHIDLTSY